MTARETRNFECPESQTPCIEKRCLKDHLCVLREEEQIAAAQAAARRERTPDPDIEKDIGAALRAIVINRKNIKNPPG
jgi:hypothetical protein